MRFMKKSIASLECLPWWSNPSRQKGASWQRTRRTSIKGSARKSKVARSKQDDGREQEHELDMMELFGSKCFLYPRYAKCHLRIHLQLPPKTIAPDHSLRPFFTLTKHQFFDAHRAEVFEALETLLNNPFPPHIPLHQHLTRIA